MVGFIRREWNNCARLDLSRLCRQEKKRLRSSFQCVNYSHRFLFLFFFFQPLSHNVLFIWALSWCSYWKFVRNFSCICSFVNCILCFFQSVYPLKNCVLLKQYFPYNCTKYLSSLLNSYRLFMKLFRKLFINSVQLWWGCCFVPSLSIF